jgi:hypothetical protein
LEGSLLRILISKVSNTYWIEKLIWMRNKNGLTS